MRATASRRCTEDWRATPACVCDAYDLGSIDVLFLCSAHGESRKWLEANTVPAGVKIIDLAQDFRDESGGDSSTDFPN